MVSRNFSPSMCEGEPDAPSRRSPGDSECVCLATSAPSSAYPTIRRQPAVAKAPERLELQIRRRLGAGHGLAHEELPARRRADVIDADTVVHGRELELAAVVPRAQRREIGD